MNTSPSWRPPMFSLVCMVGAAANQSIARIEWGPVLAAARSTAGWLVSGALLLFSLVFRSGGSAEEAHTSIYKAIALINWRAGLAAVRSFAERCGWQRLASAAFALLILLFASRGFQFKSRGVSLSLNVVSRSALCPDPRSRRAAAATLYSRYVCTSGGGASNPFDPSFGRPSETVARSCQFENVCWVNGSLKFFVAPGQGAGFIDEVATSTVRKGAPDGNFSPDVVLGPRPRDVPFSSAPFSILFSGYCAENFGVRAQASSRSQSIDIDSKYMSLRLTDCRSQYTAFSVPAPRLMPYYLHHYVVLSGTEMPPVYLCCAAHDGGRHLRHLRPPPRLRLPRRARARPRGP